MLPLYLLPSRLCSLHCLYRVPINNLRFQIAVWSYISQISPVRWRWHIPTLWLPLENITNQKRWFRFWQCRYLHIFYIFAHLILYIILNLLINIIYFLHSWLLAAQLHLFLRLGICLALDAPLMNLILILPVQILFQPVSRPSLPWRCTLHSVLLFWLVDRTWSNTCLLNTTATPLRTTPSALTTSCLWT